MRYGLRTFFLLAHQEYDVWFVPIYRIDLPAVRETLKMKLFD
jgi:hypothetical protein